MLLGIVSLEVKEEYQRFLGWLSNGKNAGMDYLKTNLQIRENPALLLQGAKTAIILGLPYAMAFSQNDMAHPQVAQYALFRDYHRVLKERGEILFERFKRNYSQDAKYRVLVDTAPVLEKALAAKTPFGFLGKNSLYIHPKYGSYLLLAEILTSLSFPVDEKEPLDPERRTLLGGCGSCSSCQVSCPTGALSQSYSIDASLCLSYWTIEHRGTIDEKFWPWLKEYWFGCDICQRVCPFNQWASNNTLPKNISPLPIPTLYEVATMDNIRYQKYFGGTALTRSKRNGLRRNALIAMAVTKDPDLRRAMVYASHDDGYPIRETLQQISHYLARLDPLSVFCEKSPE